MSEAIDRPTGGARLFVLRLVAGLVLAQTLFFKFTGAPESVAIFEALGVEPWGRLAAGAVELVTVVLLLAPLGRRAVALGGLFTVGTMVGAVLAHLTVLGIEVEGDGGLLFSLALMTLGAGLLVTWGTRDALPLLGRDRS